MPNKNSLWVNKKLEADWNINIIKYLYQQSAVVNWYQQSQDVNWENLIQNIFLVIRVVKIYQWMSSTGFEPVLKAAVGLRVSGDHKNS